MLRKNIAKIVACATIITSAASAYGTMPVKAETFVSGQKIEMIQNVRAYGTSYGALNLDSIGYNIYYAGTYYIYKSVNGATNISKTPGVPGAWVADFRIVTQKAAPTPTPAPTPAPAPVPAPTPAPAPAPAPVKVSQVTISDNLPSGTKINMLQNVRAYSNSTSALNLDSVGYTIYYAGTYYVYKQANGATNISKTPGVPGAWVDNKRIFVSPTSVSTPVVTKPSPVVVKGSTGIVDDADVDKTVPTGYKWTLPSGLGLRKSYMRYTAISAVTSPHYKLQRDSLTKTGSYGIRYYRNLPMVAVSKNYGSVGDVINITLSSGMVFKAVIGDVKAVEYDFYNYTRYHNFSYDYAVKWGIHNDGSIVEFIMDPNSIDSYIRLTGGLEHIYKGYVVSIQKMSN